VSDKAERQKRKAYLLSQIQQQRLDLSASRRDWIDATRRFDRGWNTFLSLRSWALVGSSVMAIWTVRHPNMLIRWASRLWCLERLASGESNVASAAVALAFWPVAATPYRPTFILFTAPPYSISLKRLTVFLANNYPPRLLSSPSTATAVSTRIAHK
jgi:hypothetical protein